MPLKSLSAPEGQLDRHRGASEAPVNAFERALEAGAVTVELVDDDGARKFELLGDTPHSSRSATSTPATRVHHR